MMMAGNGQDPNDYIKRGLVFHLDGADFDGTEWVDRVGGITYTANGNVYKSGDGVYLGGSNQDFLHSNGYESLYTTSTIEVVFRCDSTGYGILLFPNDGLDICYIFNSNNRISFHINGSYATKLSGATTATFTHSISNSYNYFNGVAKGNGSNESWAIYPLPIYGSTIGVRTRTNMPNDYPVKGLLYQIRIYNRVLQEVDVLHNANIDAQKYNITL